MYLLNVFLWYIFIDLVKFGLGLKFKLELD